MKWIYRNEIFPIGLDLGYDSIKLMQLQTNATHGLSVLAAARQSASPEAQANPLNRIALSMNILHDILSRGQFSGKNIVATIPREYIQAKNLRLPVMPDNELKSAIDFESRTLFSHDPSQLHIRHIPCGEVRQGNEVKTEAIVVAVEQRKVDELLEHFNQAGLIVDALDFEPHSIYRGLERFMRRAEDDMEVNVFLDVGGRQSTVIIGRGHDINFTKSIDIGGRHLTDAVSRKLQLTIEEARSLRRRFSTQEMFGEKAVAGDPVRQAVVDATRNLMGDLARELSLCLRYYSVTFRGQRPARVRLTGGEASDPILMQVLQQQISIPTEVFKPLHGVDTAKIVSDEFYGPASEWCTAFGAALRRVKPNQAARRVTSENLTIGRRRHDAPLAEVIEIPSVVTTQVQTPPIVIAESAGKEDVHA